MMTMDKDYSERSLSQRSLSSRGGDTDEENQQQQQHGQHVHHPPHIKNDGLSAKQQQRARRMFALLRTIALLFANIVAWYGTNGFNGISMQSFASKVRNFSSAAAAVARADPPTSTAALDDGATFGFIAFVTATVTAMQLLLGAIVGWAMLSAYSYLQHDGGWRNNGAASAALRQYSRRVFSLDASGASSFSRKGETIAAILHTAGSVCTNLGFMYGSASLIQIIKLLEPFEILLLTKLILDEESKVLSVGVVSSMTTTVGGAISLIKSRKAMPHPNAVLFAVLSGFCLCSRNVLQRRQHGIDLKSRSQDDSASSRKHQSQSHSDHHHQQQQRQKDDDGSSSNSSQLEQALLQFTRISYLSGLLLSVFSLLLHSLMNLSLMISSHGSSGGPEQQHVGPFALTAATLVGTLDAGVLAWHPLYNAFSMITLGFCSALTHSLLNAGKRVFAILLAIVWFHEGFSRRTVAGLALVSIGAYWYTVETKRPTGTAEGRGDRAADAAVIRRWLKAMVPLVLLSLNALFA